MRPRAIQNGDWVLIYDKSLDNQHSTSRKFAKRWFGPYVVKQTYNNTTYLLKELDGMELKIPIAGKRIKLFKRRGDDHSLGDLDDNLRIIGNEDKDDFNNNDLIEDQ